MCNKAEGRHCKLIVPSDYGDWKSHPPGFSCGTERLQAADIVDIPFEKPPPTTTAQRACDVTHVTQSEEGAGCRWEENEARPGWALGEAVTGAVVGCPCFPTRGLRQTLSIKATSPLSITLCGRLFLPVPHG